MIVFYDSVISHHKIIFNFTLICIFDCGIRQVPFGNCHKMIEMAEHVQRHRNSGLEICSHSFLRKYYTIKLKPSHVSSINQTINSLVYRSISKMSVLTEGHLHSCAFICRCQRISVVTSLLETEVMKMAVM